MYIAQETIRESLAEKTRKLIAIDYTDADLKAAAQNWLDTYCDGEANKAATKAYVAALEAGRSESRRSPSLPGD